MVLKVLKDEAGNVIHACAVGSFPLPAGHWIYGEPVQPSAIDDDLPPDVRSKLRDALRYTLQVCTSRGKDDFDPDAVCMTLENTLLGSSGNITTDAEPSIAKWKVGPAVLNNGSEAFIHFVQIENETYTYIGRANLGGVWAAMHWSSNGNWVYGNTNHDFSLRPQENAIDAAAATEGSS